jgi:hypothetical protein
MVMMMTVKLPEWQTALELRLSDPYGGRSVPATILPRNGEMNT